MTASSNSGIAIASATQRYWLPETVLGAGLVIAAVALCGFSAASIPILYLAATTPALVRIDITEHRLPNALVLPGLLLVAGAVGARWISEGDLDVVLLVGCGAVFVVLLVMNIAGGLGMGDVKLGTLIAGALWMVNPLSALTAGAVAVAVGGLVSLLLLITEARTARTQPIAFGPFLLAGFWVALVWANPSGIAA